MATAKKTPKPKAKGKAKKGNGSAKPSKKETATKSAKPSADLTAPIELAKKVKKSEGPCEAIRAVAQKFKALKRHDVMTVAEKTGINSYTASRQFHLLRSGEVKAAA